jgi:predicted permease
MTSLMASLVASPVEMIASLSLITPVDPVQLVSLLGAVMQLLAYALMQLGRLDSASYSYQLANVIGSLLMTIVATLNHEYGFILMEGVWCLTSAYGLIRLMRQSTDVASPS